MIQWLHHLFNPHCSECREEKELNNICESCNVLRQENAQLRKHNDQLIQSLLESVKPKVPEQIIQPIIQPEPVSRGRSWRVIRQTLEQEDKARAEILRKKTAEMESVPIDKLEVELGIDDAIRSSNA